MVSSGRLLLPLTNSNFPPAHARFLNSKFLQNFGDVTLSLRSPSLNSDLTARALQALDPYFFHL